MKKLLFAAVAMSPMVILGLGAVQEPRTMPSPMSMEMMQSCGMSVKGAEVATANTSDGIRVTITTTSGNVADLRQRVEGMAKMHSDGSNEAAMHQGMIPFTLQYEEIPTGASLTLTPKDSARLEEFRTKVREHAERMKGGDCSMMQGMMKGMTPKPETKAEPKPNEEDHSAHHPEGIAK